MKVQSHFCTKGYHSDILEVPKVSVWTISNLSKHFIDISKVIPIRTYGEVQVRIIKTGIVNLVNERAACIESPLKGFILLKMATLLNALANTRCVCTAFDCVTLLTEYSKHLLWPFVWFLGATDDRATHHPRRL